jgi:ABC-type antimicrobial peptide transport system permease subunit
MSRTMVATLAGAAAGLLMALGATRLLRGFLYGVEPSDPAALGAAVAGLCAFAVVVAASPALRSARLNPVESLGRE